jgi:hypothetical protein
MLTKDGSALSIQRGVFLSWFANKRLRQSMGDAYNEYSSRVSAQRKLWNEIKNATRNSIKGV